MRFNFVCHHICIVKRNPARIISEDGNAEVTNNFFTLVRHSFSIGGSLREGGSLFSVSAFRLSAFQFFKKVFRCDPESLSKFFGFVICVRSVTRSILNELHLRVCTGAGLRRGVARVYSAGCGGVGSSSWLVEPPQFPTRFYGIDNHCRDLFPPGSVRVIRRFAAFNAETNGAVPPRSPNANGRSLRRVSLLDGKQSRINPRRNFGRCRRTDRRICRLRNQEAFSRRVACQRHFRRFARRLGRDRTRLFLRFTLTPAASRGMSCKARWHDFLTVQYGARLVSPTH